MRLYLDNGCLQRPMDDQSHPRVRIETEALFAVLTAVEAGEISRLDLEALQSEIGRIPDDTRRTEALAILSLASERLQVTNEVETLAMSFEAQGLRPLDALHLALASIARADYFCTCDDKLFRKAQNIPHVTCKLTTLLRLIPEISP